MGLIQTSITQMSGPINTVGCQWKVQESKGLINIYCTYLNNIQGGGSVLVGPVEYILE